LNCSFFSGAQIVVNYAASAGAAEAVAEEIKQLGGDAIVVGANLSNREEIQGYARLRLLAASLSLSLSLLPTSSVPGSCSLLSLGTSVLIHKSSIT
jgi:hypothetical protein